MRDDLESLKGLLQLERCRLRALTQHSRDGVILLGNDAQVLIINTPALHHLDLLGDPDTWIGRSFIDVVRDLRGRAPEITAQSLEELHRIRSRDGQPGEGEYRIGLCTIHWLSLPIEEDGLQIGHLVILRDVTEARQLKSLREDLTHTMVNDLREPLGDLASSLEALDQDIGAQVQREQRRALQQSIECVGTMLSNVNEFIEISALESGRLPLSPSAFSFPELVDTVFEVEQPLAEQRQLRLECRISRSLPLTWGDRNLIQRVLHNLISNAVRLTPPGGKVAVEAGPEPRDIDKIHVSVTDTGRSSTYRLTDQLFQKFPTGDRDAAGNGLDMAFCRLVLEAHGEKIWIARSSTAGTTITFTLPQLSDPLRTMYAIQ